MASSPFLFRLFVPYHLLFFFVPVHGGFMRHHPSLFSFMTLRRQTTSFSSRSSSTTSFVEAQDILFDRMEQCVDSNRQTRRNSTADSSSASSCRLVVAVAGGGTSFAATLAATPGASSLLLEAITLYDRESFLSFTKKNAPPPPPPTSAQPQSMKPFQFASRSAAQMAATAALQRALQLTVGPTTSARSTYRSLQCMPYTVGLACASQLWQSPLSDANTTTTTTTTRSQAYIVAQLPHGPTVQMACSIPSSLSRRQQDVHVAHSMLSCLGYALQCREDCYNCDSSDTTSDSVCALWKQRLEQLPVTTTLLPSSTSQRSSVVEWTETADQGEERQIQVTFSGCPVREAAQAIVTEQESVMLLLPQQQQQQQYRVVRGSVATLPPHSLIVPGSFNPPHTGHVQLALAALQSLPTQPNPVIWFELSLTNADKPALKPQAAVERLQYFWDLTPELHEYQWGILLTNAPLFAQKINLLHPMTGEIQNDPDSDDILTFCIGTDTLVRLLDPKYYQNSREQMLTTLEQLPCHFVAGGRVDPKQPNVFVTGEAAVAELPPHLAAKFTLLPEFRVDISSTELRRQRQQLE